VKKTILTLCVAILLTNYVSALPLWTEETFTLPPGAVACWPILYFYLPDRDIDNSGNPVKFSGARSAATLTLENQFYFGFTKNSTLRLVLPMQMNYSVENSGTRSEFSGFEDLELKWLYRFKDEDHLPALATLLGITLPTGNYAEGAGRGSPSYNVILISDKRFGLLKLYGALGYLYQAPFNSTVEGGYFKSGDRIQYQAAADYIFNEKWVGVFEMIGRSTFDSQLNGATRPGSAWTEIFLLPEISYILDRKTMLFATVEIPVVYNKSGGTTGLVPMLSVYHIF
jgi:hypothetical protein